MKGNGDDDDKSEAASLVAEVQSIEVQVYDPTTGDASKIGTYCGSILCVITRWSSHRCYIFFACASVDKRFASVGAEVAQALAQGRAGDVVSSRAFQCHSVSVGRQTRRQIVAPGLVAMFSALMPPSSSPISVCSERMLAVSTIMRGSPAR